MDFTILVDFLSLLFFFPYKKWIASPTVSQTSNHHGQPG